MCSVAPGNYFEPHSMYTCFLLSSNGTGRNNALFSDRAVVCLQYFPGNKWSTGYRISLSMYQFGPVFYKSEVIAGAALFFLQVIIGLVGLGCVVLDKE